MKISFKRKLAALILAVLLVVGMSPAAFAARETGRIILEKNSVKLAIGASALLLVDYTEIEEIDGIDIFRAKVYVDKPEVAEAGFGSDGSDISALEITGVSDGVATVIIKVGRFYSQCVVTVGRGNKSPAQIKKEEEAKKAEEEAIKNDKSELGIALTEALKKSTKREVIITTTSVKDPVIAPVTLRALAARAGQAKKYAIVRVDSPGADGKVQARMFVDPAGLTALKTDFKTGVTVDKSRQGSLGSGYIASVKCEYTGSFGTFTEIAVRISVPKDVEKLSVYNVGSDGKFKKIEEPSCSVDKDGFLHFYTREGGESIIVNGTLS